MTTWKRFAYVETGGNSDLMTISNIPATAKYIRLIFEVKRNGGMDNVSFRFNGDTNNNYTWHKNTNGDSTNSQANYNYLRFWFQGGADGHAVIDIINLVNREKLVMTHAVCHESAGDAEIKNTTAIGKWTADALIGTITIHEFAGSSTFGDGTSVTVLIPDEGSLVYDYPDLPNGTIFEQSDDGKHFMFDGTDTWNEVT